MPNTVLDYLSSAVVNRASAIAVRDKEDSLTYDKLYALACGIAGILYGADVFRRPVVIFLPKQCQTIAAIWGTLLAGAHYTVLDPHLPPLRIANLLDTLQPAAVLTAPQHLAALSASGYAGQVVSLRAETVASANTFFPDTAAQGLTGQDLAYILFTSGSSGTPKGVMIRHASLLDFIETFTDVMGIRADDILGNQAPLDFDVSVKDIFSAARAGATLQLVEPQFFSFPASLVDYLDKNGVTVLIWAVSALCILSSRRAFEYKIPRHIRQVIFSGEVMPPGQLSIWRKALPGARFVNTYGPTEITCNCTYHILDNSLDYVEGIPIGRPFPRREVFLLDDHGREVPAGQPRVLGEIYVGGPGVAAGYANYPAETAKVFVPHPLRPDSGDRVYKTGDMAWYGPDGNLYYRGRRDFQVKVMGRRIELPEIENRLNALDGVEQACCVFNAKVGRIFCMYAGTVDAKTARSQLRQALPEYMVPERLMSVEAMPVNTHGKIDRAQVRNLLCERSTPTDA